MLNLGHRSERHGSSALFVIVFAAPSRANFVHHVYDTNNHHDNIKLLIKMSNPHLFLFRVILEKISRLGGYTARIFCPLPRFATISLVPDSEGHKPKRNDNNSCGVTQHHKYTAL